ncbi:MAG: AsmA family protein [Candidatus Dadabacteria bacterium]|nr:AsmA family protein [Candidatus Dadabacteria bacterium]NIS09649.1 AsmA family protein [Candidatus Dadabacteria bacterium]NIV41127.1 AsmA family protein [Candidatus Dadabacteria bacterium]NIX16120.1 AsmA family protein [Candidatus Dadabacteria bacterium]NIY21670.1 AsmA family protein [Candidatus Dadabacteria bacterium]
MYRALKRVLILSIIFVIFLCICIYGFLNINKLIDQNKEYIVSQVEKAVGRDVSVGKIRLNLMGGIGLNLTGLNIKDDPGYHSGNFIETSSLIVSLKLMPLLSKEVQVKKIILNEPVIKIIKSKNGEFNFSTLAKSDRPKEAEPKQGDGQVKDFNVSLLDISGGLIQYIDLKDRSAVELKNIDLSLQNIGFDDEITASLSFSLLEQKQNININGSIGPVGQQINTDTIPVKLDLQIRSLDIKKLKRSMPQLEQSLPPDIRHIDSLSLKTRIDGDLSKLRLTDIDLASGLFGSKESNLIVNGSIGPVGPAVPEGDMFFKLALELGPINSKQLLSIDSLKTSILPDLSMSGPITFKANIEGSPSNISIKNGLLEATDTGIVFGKSFNKPQGTEFILKTDANLIKENLELKNTNLKLSSLQLDIDGNYNTESSKADINLKSNKVDLAELSKIMPDLATYNLAGVFETDAKINGYTAEGKTPNINGFLKLTGVSAKPEQLAKPIKELNSEIKFTGNSASLDKTDLVVGNSKISIISEASSFSPLSVSYVIVSPKIYMADISPENKTDESINDVTITGKVFEQVGTMIHNATIKSRSGKLSSLGYSNLNGKLSIKDDVISLDEMAMNVLSATINATGIYDISEPKPAFDLKTKIQGLSITNLTQSLFRSTNEHIRGNSDLNINISGSGNSWEDIKPTLSGVTKINLKEGELVDFNIAEGVLSGITGVSGLSGLVSSSLKSKYPQVFQSKSTVFYDMKSVLKIKEGKINFNDLILRATDYFVKGDGWVSLDKGVKVNGVLNLSEQFSNDLIANAGFVKYLRNADNQIQIPFDLSGLLPNVSPKPDLGYVAKSLKGAAIDKGKDELQKRVIDKIIPKNTDPDSETDENSENVQPKSLEEELLQKGLDKVLDF